MKDDALEIIVHVNGQPKHVADGISLVAFLESLHLTPGQVVVEYNTQPLVKSDYEKIHLVEGDRLELVRAVAGG